MGVLVRRHLQGDSLVQRAARIRSRSLRCTSRIAIPASAASCTASAIRSSAVVPSATCSAVAGTPARRHSTTGLRPPISGASSSWRRCRRRTPRSRLRGVLGGCGGRRAPGALAHLGGRGRAAALQRAAALAAGADDRRPSSCRPCASRRDAGSCRPCAQDPSVSSWAVGVSSTAMPAAVSRSRTASAAAKSLRARASCRCASRRRRAVGATGRLLVRRRRWPSAGRAGPGRARRSSRARPTRARRRGVVARVERGVALAHGAVDDRERAGVPRSSSRAAANAGGTGDAGSAPADPLARRGARTTRSAGRRRRPRRARRRSTRSWSGSAGRQGSSAARRPRTRCSTASIERRCCPATCSSSRRRW